MLVGEQRLLRSASLSLPPKLSRRTTASSSSAAASLALSLAPSPRCFRGGRRARRSLPWRTTATRPPRSLARGGRQQLTRLPPLLSLAPSPCCTSPWGTTSSAVAAVEDDVELGGCQALSPAPCCTSPWSSPARGARQPGRLALRLPAAGGWRQRGPSPHSPPSSSATSTASSVTRTSRLSPRGTWRAPAAHPAAMHACVELDGGPPLLSLHPPRQPWRPATLLPGSQLLEDDDEHGGHLSLGLPPSVSNNTDCSAWDNDPSNLCYGCQSCKAGVLANIKHDWKKVAVVDITFLILLIIVYSMGCCAFRNNSLGVDTAIENSPTAVEDVELSGRLPPSLSLSAVEDDRRGARRPSSLALSPRRLLRARRPSSLALSPRRLLRARRHLPRSLPVASVEDGVGLDGRPSLSLSPTPGSLGPRHRPRGSPLRAAESDSTTAPNAPNGEYSLRPAP